MPDRSFLDWPFFEPRHRALAESLDAWAAANLGAIDHADTDAACNGLYDKLRAAGVDVLHDDTEERAGAKFATMDLIGLPYQLVVGPKGVKAGEVEVKSRKDASKETLSPDDAVRRVVNAIESQRVLA